MGRVGGRLPALAARLAPATFMAFDVLVVDGVDVCSRPWHERREILDELAQQETSTVWRATGPLRHAGTTAKITAARMHARWSAVRGSSRYVGLAMTVLRNEGPRALARRPGRPFTTMR